MHRVTGEIRILHSVHAADIGRLINPMQCRGQIDGAIAMGIGWALTENMVYDADGTMVNPALRNYRIPAFADVPRSEVFFADTYDTIGPLGAKSQGECAINPVAPAIANALANATGVRFAHLPLTPDRIFAKLGSASGADRAARPARRIAPAPVTIVTQTRVRAECGRRIRPLAGRRSAQRSAEFPGFIEQTVMPPSPPAQVDWVILQRFADAEAAVAWLHSEQRLQLLDEAQPMLVGRDDVHLVQRRRRGRAARAGLGRDLDARQAGPGGRVPRLGAAHRRRPGAMRRASRAIGSNRRSRACRTTGWRSCASTPRRNLQAWLNSPERQKLLEEAEAVHRGIPRPHRAHGLRPVVPGGDSDARRRRPGSRTCSSCCCSIRWCSCSALWVQTPLLMGRVGLPFWLALFIGNVVSVLLLN